MFIFSKIQPFKWHSFTHAVLWRVHRNLSMKKVTNGDLLKRYITSVVFYFENQKRKPRYYRACYLTRVPVKLSPVSVFLAPASQRSPLWAACVSFHSWQVCSCVYYGDFKRDLALKDRNPARTTLFSRSTAGTNSSLRSPAMQRNGSWMDL